MFTQQVHLQNADWLPTPVVRWLLEIQLPLQDTCSASSPVADTSCFFLACCSAGGHDCSRWLCNGSGAL